jgi:ubiquinone/menaquinone biosynthesis C-methylase UbiE
MAMEKKEAYTFTSADAENYDFYLGPVLFEPYGQYLAGHIDAAGSSRVLELAGGTGRVTRHLRKALPASVELWATDLSGDMLTIAKRELGDDGINFKTEDIQNLSFADNTFDMVICQFGMMFLPDKRQGFNEIFRVLKPGGKLICFTWDSTLNNPLFGLLINELMLPLFADEDPTRFFTPFSLHNPQQLAGWLNEAGFRDVKIDTIALKSGSATLEHLETGVLRKHPLGKAVYDKNPSAYEDVVRKFKEGIVDRWGDVDISFPMSALMTVGVK